MNLMHRKPADGIASLLLLVMDLVPSNTQIYYPLQLITICLKHQDKNSPQGTPDNGYLWQRVNSRLREALAQAQSSRIGASAQALRESLHPKKLELWEKNLSESSGFGNNREVFLFLDGSIP